MTASAHASRAARLAAALGSEFDFVVLVDPANVRWLTGYAGTNGVALLRDATATLLTDVRYVGTRLRDDVELSTKPLGDHLSGVDGLSVGFEADRAPWSLGERLCRAVGQGGRGHDVTPFLRELRATKDKAELRAIREAAKATVSLFAELADWLSPDQTENDVARFIRQWATANADGAAFDPIVAAGTNGGTAHHSPTDDQLGKDLLVTIDCGVVVDGMHADMTRTFALGVPSEELQRDYEMVRRVAERARARVARGGNGAEHDGAVREHFERFDVADHFVTGLGHGVGLEIHEAPMLVPSSTDTVGPDMALTIEPGLYRSAVGGVRIEDLIITSTGGDEPGLTTEILTDFERALISL